MKPIQFTKMVGAGNDFIVIHGPLKTNLSQLAARVCDRHSGIGADGLLVLQPSKNADYRMRIINADGSEAEMCGNGARCMAAYIVGTQKEKKRPFGIETIAGVVLAEAKGEIASVRLSDPKDYQSQLAIKLSGRSLSVSCIDSGVPHTVVFVDSLKEMDVNTLGRAIRFHDQFKPRGTNVNFVEQIDEDSIELRTYERGVEAETLACGTGAAASAIIAFLKAHPGMAARTQACMKVKTTGQEVLDVSFDFDKGNISNVWLKGSARFVARGEYLLGSCRFHGPGCQLSQ